MAKEKTRKFRVNAMVTISVYTDVMARTKAEAVQLAGQHGMAAVFHSGEDETEEWVTSGELDGEPYELRAEVADDDD